MIIVSDTSPVTTLLRIRRVELLQQLYGEVFIPGAVRDELSRAHQSLPDFFQCKTVKNKSEVDRLLSEIDPGEAEAIVLAKELKADLLLIDELEGRAVATREGVAFIGLIGVLLQSKEEGYVSSVREIIRELEIKTTFRLSEAMKTKTLQSAGEL